MGVKQRRCRAQAMQTGLSSCAPIWATIAPQPTLTQKQKRGLGGVLQPPGAQKPREGKATQLGGLQRPCPFRAYVKGVSDAYPQKRPGPETPGRSGGGGEWGWGAPCAPPAAPSARAPGLLAVSVRLPDPRSHRPLPDGPGRAEPSYLRPGTCWPPCPPARPRSPSRAPPAAAASASTAAAAAAASPRGRGRDGEGTPREGAVPAPSAGRATPSGPGRPERGGDGATGCGGPKTPGPPALASGSTPGSGAVEEPGWGQRFSHSERLSCPRHLSTLGQVLLSCFCPQGYPSMCDLKHTNALLGTTLRYSQCRRQMFACVPPSW